jgi:predicted Zn-dependent protease
LPQNFIHRKKLSRAISAKPLLAEVAVSLTINFNKMTTLKEAISKITKELKNDKDYRRSWSANIAMAYIDNERWYKQKTGKKTLNRKDKHAIANNAAEHFLKLLCDEYK